MNLLEIGYRPDRCTVDCLMPDDRHEPIRASRRVKVFQPAALRCADGHRRIHLLDVSRTGILGHALSPPDPGERVELDCAGLVAAARVRWRDGRRFGLEFDTPLTQDRLEVLAREGGAAAPGLETGGGRT